MLSIRGLIVILAKHNVLLVQWPEADTCAPPDYRKKKKPSVSVNVVKASEVGFFLGGGARKPIFSGILGLRFLSEVLREIVILLNLFSLFRAYFISIFYISIVFCSFLKFSYLILIDASDVAESATLNQRGIPVAFMTRTLQGSELH